MFDTQFDRCQAFTDTGAGYTVTTVDLEQCIMGRALDEAVIHIKELVFLPFKIDAGMRAAVDVGIESTVLVYNK